MSKHLDVWEFMLSHQQQNGGTPPTTTEIAQAIPRLNHRSSARYAITALSRQGLVEEVRDPFKSRRWQAVSDGRSVCKEAAAQTP